MLRNKPFKQLWDLMKEYENIHSNVVKISEYDFEVTDNNYRIVIGCNRYEFYIIIRRNRYVSYFDEIKRHTIFDLLNDSAFHTNIPDLQTLATIYNRKHFLKELHDSI